ncbi:hypothetical protein HK099_005382 [Clydaea vesicula]|uniref:Band 7 domain-containing protein n=1 Tax=Clydaea vesicula TaxID=447962 RepID=A0AAD5XZ01_9FUNG|nr:hypothetical protein HK099_005382 [Clydaea vesicula]
MLNLKSIQELNQKMISLNLGHLISHKNVHRVFGRRVLTGQLGFFDNSGTPKIAIAPGCYWNWSLSHTWINSIEMNAVVNILGLTIAQVGQGEALVVQDPQNRVFIVRNGGFVAYGANGRFKILEVVDTLNLGDAYAIKESDSNRILGWKRDVVETANGSSYTAATFLNIPANNIGILQRGNKLISLGAGQHVITSSTTFRSFFTLGERQHTFKTQPAYTLETVPVVLTLNLRYKVFDPARLTLNYDDALQALISPAQTAVNSVVSRLSYTQFMRAKNATSADIPNDNHVHWVEEFKNECLRELTELAITHGINVISLEVMDRELAGSLGRDLEIQAEKVLRNQVEASQIALQNQINTDVQKTTADTKYYASQRQADAEYYACLKKAAGAAEASALQTDQEAKNICKLADAEKARIQLLASAYESVTNEHAKRMQLGMMQVEMRKVLPKSTVFFEGATSNGLSAESCIMNGFNTAQGFKIAEGFK